MIQQSERDFGTKNVPYKSEERLSSSDKNIWIISEPLDKLFCGLMRQKRNFLEGVCPVTAGLLLSSSGERSFRQQQDMVMGV